MLRKFEIFSRLTRIHGRTTAQQYLGGLGLSRTTRSYGATKNTSVRLDVLPEFV